MQKLKRPVSVILSILMVVSMFAVVPISASAAEETSTVTWNSFSGTGGMSSGGVTLTTQQAKTRVGENFYKGRGSATFTAPEGSVFTKIELKDAEYYDSLNFPGATVAESGGYWDNMMPEDPEWIPYYTVTWTGEASEVTFSGAIYGIQSIVFTLKSTAPDYVATVNGTGYETLEDAFAAAVDGDTITLLADCAGNGIKAPQGKFTNGLTVDFAGKTYTVDGETVGSTGTETNGFQLLKDNKITFENGTITSEKAKILVQNYSNLTLEGMTLTLNNPSYAYAYTLSNNNGDVVIDDTTINANPAGGFAFDVCRYSSYPSVNVTVTGDSEINGNVEVSASSNGALNGFSLTLEGGTMTGDIVIDASAKDLINDGGTVTKKSTFDQDPPTNYMWSAADANGIQTIVPVVATLTHDETTTNYATLEAAFAAAVDGDTITVLTDCAGNGIIVPEGKFTNGLTVDFANHTYTVDGNILAGSTGTKTQAFQLLKNNKVTFKNGTIYSEKALMLVQNYSNLTLDGMTLDGSKLVGNGRYTLSNNNGNVVIDGTTIIAKEGAGNYAFDVCRYSSYPSVHVTVKGNSVINGDVEISASGSDAKDGFSLTLESGTLNGDIVLDATAKTAMAAAPEKAKVTKDNDFTQAAPAGYKWDANGVLVPVVYVAQIGDNKYETLEAAFAAAVDGDTITVLADSTGNGIKAPQGKFATGLTVDFDGHSYTVDGTTVGSTGTETQAFQLLMNNTITFKNGTLTSDKAQMIIQNYSNLTLDNMVIDGTQMAGDGNYALSNNNGNVVIKDTTITAREGCIAFDVCRYASYPSVNVTVTGDSEINGDVEISASGSDAKDGFSLTLESGTMNGNIVVDPTAAAAMAATPAKAEVTKADTFTQTAPADFEWVSNSDGTSSLAAIEYVAKIGDTKYRTLEDAFAAAVDGDTITVLADSAGNGIKAPQGKFGTKGLTVDFNNHTYTVDGTTVGSTGTETQAFQLLMNNTITFKNGTLTSDKAQMIIQNYSNLTLDNMVIDGTQMAGDGNYALSNNNGNVVIKDTTITAREGCIAFDVCRYANYPSVNVTVKGNSVINGNVEVYASSSDPKNGFSLTLAGGTLNGDIVVDPTAAAAMAATPDKAEVDKATGFTAAAPAGYVWVADATDGGQTLAKAVAEIDGTSYATLEDAFAAAVDGDTITVLADCNGNGIIVPEGKFGTNGLTVDFDGHKYTVDGDTLAGSTGTKTQAFQLLKDNKVTFENGTIYSEKAKMIIQNYSNLTLDNMVIDGTQMAGDGNYALSNNNGNVVIKDTTITARKGCIAFDVCRYASYPSVNVTVTGDSVINGNVEVYASGSDAKDGFSLTLESGTLNGNIVVDKTAAAAMAATPAKAEVDKATGFTAAAPAGYVWVADATDGGQTLAKNPKLFVGHTVTLGGDIGVNFYLNPVTLDSYNGTKTVKFTCDGEETTVNVPATATANGYKVTLNVVAARMAHKINAVVYVGDTALDQTDSYSVQDYAEAVYYDKNKPNELKALAKAMLNYGSEAQTVFAGDLKEIPDHRADKNVGQTSYANVDADAVTAKIKDTASNLKNVAEQLNAKYYTSSLFYLQNNTLRLYFTPKTYPSAMPNASAYDGNLSNYYYYKDKAPIAAAELDNQQTFNINGVEFQYSALDYVVAVLNSNKMGPAQQNLAKSLFLYNQAANAYFD